MRVVPSPLTLTYPWCETRNRVSFSGLYWGLTNVCEPPYLRYAVAPGPGSAGQ